VPHTPRPTRPVASAAIAFATGTDSPSASRWENGPSTRTNAVRLPPTNHVVVTSGRLARGRTAARDRRGGPHDERPEQQQRDEVALGEAHVEVLVEVERPPGDVKREERQRQPPAGGERRR